MANMLKLYERAIRLKNMIEYMQDSNSKISTKQCDDCYYKLGEALYVIQGDRRSKRD